MNKITIKKGDTLALSCKLTEYDGTAINLTTVTITSQVRESVGSELVATLTATVTNAVSGEYSLTSSDTTNWPVDTLICDIKYSFSSPSVIRTETFSIEVLKAVTE